MTLRHCLVRPRFLALLLIAVTISSTAWAQAAEPPLIAATKRGDHQAVQQLLDAGVDPDAVDIHDNTALIFAARDGHFEIAALLIAKHATIDRQDKEGVTALILAAFKNRHAIAQLLLDHGADTTLRDQWNRKALDYALRRGPEDAIATMIETNTTGESQK